MNIAGHDITMGCSPGYCYCALSRGQSPPPPAPPAVEASPSDDDVRAAARALLAKLPRCYRDDATWGPHRCSRAATHRDYDGPEYSYCCLEHADRTYGESVPVEWLDEAKRLTALVGEAA